MKKIISILLTFVLVFTSLSVIGVYAKEEGSLFMPSIFDDSMVLQRDKNVPVWGESTNEGAKVTVTLGEFSKETTVKNGKWYLELDPMPKAKDLTMTVSDTISTLTYNNVALGDVILLSGQSNMAMELRKCYGYEYLITDSVNYDVRNYRQTRKGSYQEERDNLGGNWVKIDGDTAGGVEAVGYVMAYQISEKYDVAVGLVRVNLGGASIESYMDYEVLKARPEYEKIISNFAKYKSGELAENWKKAGSTLYNRMVHPLIPYACSSLVWYQGCSNSGNAKLYNYQLYDYINSWRESFRDPDMPVCVVQLAPYTSKYMDIRQVQADTSRRMKNVALITTANEGPKGYLKEELIHPQEKIPVGNRVFYALDNMCYGASYEYTGPEYTYMTIENNKPVLHFSHHGTDGLKIAKGDKLTGFTASKDGESFDSVNAFIADGDKVVIDMEGAKYVRYGWVSMEKDGTLGGNLTNSSNIPAGPFRANLYDINVDKCEMTYGKISVSITNKGYSFTTATVQVLKDGTEVVKSSLIFETVDTEVFDYNIEPGVYVVKVTDEKDNIISEKEVK